MTSDRRPVSLPSVPTRFTRTHVVWASLAAGLTVVAGLLSLTIGAPATAEGPLAAAETVRGDEPTAWVDRLFTFPDGVEQADYSGIVIHHSGATAGSSATIAAEHESRGIRLLGHHFVIGNGRGASDGQIQAGVRWQRQLPGAHVAGPNSRSYNERTIGICLVGDGDRRAFTAEQINSLLALVRVLQERYGIDESEVHLHRDVGPTASPGRLFPELQFRQRLLDLD